MAEETVKNLPNQIIIRDKELIRDLESERSDKGDSSCTQTAKKILTKYFAQRPRALASAPS